MGKMIKKDLVIDNTRDTEKPSFACEEHLDRLKFFVEKKDLRNACNTYVILLQLLDKEQAQLKGKTNHEQACERLHHIRMEANAISDKHFPWGEKKREAAVLSNGWMNLDFHIVDHCNLSCRCCSHYSCIAKERYITMEELGEALNYVQIIHPTQFNLLGGEPLLHPEIDEMLALAGEALDRDINTSLFTNGLLLRKMSDDFWDALRRYNIRLAISNYTLPLNYKELVELAVEKGVNVRLVFDDDCRFAKNLLSPEGARDGKRAYSVCRSSTLQIRDGKLYPCQQSAYIGSLNERFQTTFHHMEGDYLILSEMATRYDVVEWMKYEKPFCRYCNMDKVELIPWKSCTAHERNEWIKED